MADLETPADTGSVIHSLDTNANGSGPEQVSLGASSSGRRVSGRVKVATKFFKSELEEPPKKKVKKSRNSSVGANTFKVTKSPVKDKAKAKDTKAGTNASKSRRKSDKLSTPKELATKSKSKPKPKQKQKQKPKRKPKPKEVLPECIPIFSEQPLELTWIRITIREFLLRFDCLGQLPARQSSVIVDPTLPWNEYVYKTVVLIFLGFIFDRVSMTYASDNPLSSEVNKKAILEAALPYRSRIESVSPESEKMRLEIEELCDILEGRYVEDNDGDSSEDHDMDNEQDKGQEMKSTKIILKLKLNGNGNGNGHFGKGNALNFDLNGYEKVYYDDSDYTDSDMMELRYLKLVQRLLLQTIASTKLRFMINDAQDHQRRLHTDYLELIRKSKQNMERSLEKLSKLKVQDKAWGQRFADTKTRYVDEQAAYERFIYAVSLKHNTRTSPIGTDHLGNKYWIFQQLWSQLPSGDSPRAVVSWHKAYPLDPVSAWGSGYIVVEKNAELYSVFSELEKPHKGQNGPSSGGSGMKSDSFYSIVGAENATILAKWLRSHSKTAVYPLAREIEKFAKFV